MAAILVAGVSYRGKTNFPQLHTANKVLLTCGDTHVIPSPSRTEDHAFPYRVSCHAANDISRKRTHGIAKILLYPSFRSTLASANGPRVKRYHILFLSPSTYTGQFVFLNSRKPVKTPK
jgi:hypothetical protein